MGVGLLAGGIGGDGERRAGRVGGDDLRGGGVERADRNEREAGFEHLQRMGHGETGAAAGEAAGADGDDDGLDIRQRDASLLT